MPASFHCSTYVLLNLQFDTFYGKVKEDLQGKVELYPRRQDNETWAHYQRAMAEELDKEMIELSQPLEQQMRAFVIHKLGHFQGIHTVSVKVTLCAILYAWVFLILAMHEQDFVDERENLLLGLSKLGVRWSGFQYICPKD